MASLDSISGRLVVTFAGKETEQNWERIDTLLKEMAVELSQTSIDDSIASIRKCKEVIQETLTTERTRLAISSLNVIAGMAETMGPHYELLQDFFLYPILRLCERTNKVISERARSTLLAIFRSCPFPLRVVTSKLVECHSSPNKQLRHAVMEGLGVVVEGLSADVLAEQLEAIVRILRAGLQDAADTLPPDGYSLLSSLPTSVAKALNSDQTALSTRATSNFRSFLASKTSSEGPKSGPQRVVQKPTTFHPYSAASTELGGNKKFPRAEAMRPTAARLSRPHLPAAASVASLSAASSDKPLKPSRLPVSASTGNLGATTIPPCPSLASHANSMTSSRGFSHSGGALLAGPPPTPRAIISDFRANVTHPEWNHRQKALVDFTVALEAEQVRDYLSRSQNKVGAIFEVFEKGIKDAHHQVVAASLDLGLLLFSTFTSQQHPNAHRFSTNCIFKLFSVSMNIQFKARTTMLELCRALVDHIKVWLKSEVYFMECLTGALQIHETLEKARLPILLKVAQECRSMDQPSSELSRHKDATIQAAMEDCIVAISQLVPVNDLILNLPLELRSIWRSRLSPMEMTEVSAMASPMLEVNVITTLGSPGKAKLDLDIDMEKSNFMEDVTSIIHPSASVEPPTVALPLSNEIILDAELGITMKVKTWPPPDTPKIMVKHLSVDFDTPRSMNHPEETDESAGEEIDVHNDLDEIVEAYDNPDMDTTTTPETMPANPLPIEQLDI